MATSGRNIGATIYWLENRMPDLWKKTPEIHPDESDEKEIHIKNTKESMEEVLKILNNAGVLDNNKFNTIKSALEIEPVPIISKSDNSNTLN